MSSIDNNLGGGADLVAEAEVQVVDHTAAVLTAVAAKPLAKVADKSQATVSDAIPAVGGAHDEAPEAGEHEVDEPPAEPVAAPVDEPSAESVAPVDKTPTALSATVDEPPAEPVAALVDEPPGAEVAPVDGPPAAAREAVHATGEAHDEAQAIGKYDEEDSPAVVRDEPPDEGADEPPPPVRDKPDHAVDNVSAVGGHDAHDPAGGADDELAQGEHDVYEPPAEPVAALVDKPPGGEVAPVDMTTATLSAPVDEHPAEQVAAPVDKHPAATCDAVHAAREAHDEAPTEGEHDDRTVAALVVGVKDPVEDRVGQSRSQMAFDVQFSSHKDMYKPDVCVVSLFCSSSFQVPVF